MEELVVPRADSTGDLVKRGADSMGDLREIRSDSIVKWDPILQRDNAGFAVGFLNEF